MKKVQIVGIAGAIMLLAAACQSAPQPTTQVAAPAQSAAEATALPIETAAPAPDSEPVAPVEQEPAPTIEAPFKVRGNLAATDPATVNLANGTPTLVEFFAFW